MEVNRLIVKRERPPVPDNHVPISVRAAYITRVASTVHNAITPVYLEIDGRGRVASRQNVAGLIACFHRWRGGWRANRGAGGRGAKLWRGRCTSAAYSRCQTETSQKKPPTAHDFTMAASRNPILCRYFFPGWQETKSIEHGMKTAGKYLLSRILELCHSRPPIDNIAGIEGQSTEMGCERRLFDEIKLT